MGSGVLVYASRLRAAQMNSKSERNLKEFEKKFLTNDLRCANITKLLSEQQAIESPQTNLKKLEKSS